MKTEIVQCESGKEYIKNFDCRISADNIIFMHWNWPDSKIKVNGAIIFEVYADEDLEVLLENHAMVRRVPREGMSSGGPDNYNYKELLTEKTIMFKIFPIWSEMESETIYDQKTGNLSPLMYKRIILERRIKRDLKNIFSGFSVARFEFKDVQKLNELPHNSLQYFKYDKKTSKPVCRYPADIRILKDNEYGIIVENGYDIDLQCSGEYGGAVVIKDFK